MTSTMLSRQVSANSLYFFLSSFWWKTGLRSENWEDIKRNMITLLHTISEEKFQRCFNQWKICWNECIEYLWDYSEKNKSFLCCSFLSGQIQIQSQYFLNTVSEWRAWHTKDEAGMICHSSRQKSFTRFPGICAQ